MKLKFASIALLVFSASCTHNFGGYGFGGPDYHTPEATFNSYKLGWQNLNANQLANCFYYNSNRKQKTVKYNLQICVDQMQIYKMILKRFPDPKQWDSQEDYQQCLTQSRSVYETFIIDDCMFNDINTRATLQLVNENKAYTSLEMIYTKEGWKIKPRVFAVPANRFLTLKKLRDYKNFISELRTKTMPAKIADPKTSPWQCMRAVKFEIANYLKFNR